MFDLEKSIADWRRQMLAGGVKAPVPLDELESHLREEIEGQIQSGASEQEAFQQAVLQIGHAKELKKEFVKDRYLLSFLGRDKFQTIDRLLGAVWLILCSVGFFNSSRLIIWVISHLTSAHGQDWRLLVMNFLLLLLQAAIYGTGILGSILVIRGTKLGRWIIGTMASLLALLSLCIVFHLVPTGPKSYPVAEISIFTAFYAITVWLMFLPRHSNLKPARQ